MKRLKKYNLFTENTNIVDDNDGGLSKLEKLKKEFDKFNMWGYNSYESAERAVKSTFVGMNVTPHIYRDEYEDASHLFFEDEVLFFNNSIYKKK